MSGNVVNCCVFFSRQYPWSGASVIGLIICRLQVMEYAPIVSGNGKRRWLQGKKTRIRDSWFGLRTKAHTCAISVLNHARRLLTTGAQARRLLTTSFASGCKFATEKSQRIQVQDVWRVSQFPSGEDGSTTTSGTRDYLGRPLPRDLAKSMDNKCTSSIDNGVRSECSANSNWRIAESCGLPSMWGPQDISWFINPIN